MELNALLEQRAALDAQIQAAKPAAVAMVLEQMKQAGLTWADFGVEPIRKKAGGSQAKRPVKYRDSDGNVWSGVGQRPVWLRTKINEGATLEQFLVPKE